MKNKHDKQEFGKDLLTWFSSNARTLPWREDRSAYRVWVSEIMLQQTRVEAVKPFFERFMKAIPTMAALASTDDDTLAKLWEGLGYYHRVRNMKKCAQICVQQFFKELPQTYEELLKLPGIGAYTAGAIASIAYGEHIPAVDGNVLRVFSRVLVSEDDILKESTKKKFQDIIKAYIPEGQSAEFNQALMELGALICVPNAAPRCNICPVQNNCIGYQSGDAHRLPNKTKKKVRRIENKTIIILVCGSHIHINQRPNHGLLGGLYEFIMIDEVVKKRELASRLSDFEVMKIITLHKTKHIFSHIEWHMNGFLVEVNKKREGIWCTSDELMNVYAIPSALKEYKDEVIQWVKEK